MHCLRYIESYDNTDTAVEGFSKNVVVTCNHIQGDIYTHVIGATAHTSVYLYTGVLNFETIRHTSSFLVCFTHVFGL
jgi:hypothetical protein